MLNNSFLAFKIKLMREFDNQSNMINAAQYFG